MPPPRDVVVLVDDSAHAAHAWAWAATSLLPCLPTPSRCRLLCIAVLPAPTTADMAADVDAPWVLASDSQARREEQRSAMGDAQDTMKALLAATPPPPGVETDPVAVPMMGSVGETIAAILREQPADVCVVGSRGMGSFKRCVCRCCV
jgi:hypothetical protein